MAMTDVTLANLGYVSCCDIFSVYVNDEEESRL